VGRRVAVLLAAAALLVGTVAGCSDDGDDGAAPDSTGSSGLQATDLPVAVDPDQETAPAAFEVRPGTEEITVTGVEPEQRLSLVDDQGDRRVVLRADIHGQAHFSYLPDELAEFQTGARAKLPTDQGFVVPAGKGYTVRLEDTEPVQVTEPFQVLGYEDHPEPTWYDDQVGQIGPSGDETDWFGYVTMRDGVQLGVNVRLPGPVSGGPYPTVIEYSGYGVSNPDETEPGSMIAGLLGFATVGVNMRGTGCSGGVFDVFNRAQQVDGYDVVEAVARQPWVQGNEVGMVGLSYSGLTQLYVAATQPPSLAAITPLSVIKDPWLQQWPGGVYNGGFTRQWLSERDSQASSGGMSWTEKRIEGGDETCEAHQQLREQNIDFEVFGKSLVRRPELADARDLSKLVSQIEVPVFLGGAWQDEQTGPQFADMLGNFTSSPDLNITLYNGRHPDGYTPQILSRWLEFLQLYVAEEVPHLDEGLRQASPALFEEFFGAPGLMFGENRFDAYYPERYDDAVAAYRAEPAVRVLFENGAGGEVPGAPEAVFETTYDTWPPSDITERSFYLGADGALGDDAPDDEGVDRFANDLDSAAEDFFGEKGYELMANTWDFDWTRFDDGDALAYISEPFTTPTVLGGPGYAELHVQVPDEDADVQVTLSLVRPDDTEWLITSGLLRLSDRAVAETSTGLRIDRTHAADVAEPMPADGFEPAKVAIPSFAQAFRPGDRLLVSISSPGRNFGAWTFSTTGEDGTPRDVAWGGARASRLVVGVLPGISVPAATWTCPSLRGQACRPYEPVTNVDAP
jgi:predicted acyl esterase